MRILRWMSDNTLRDREKNECICERGYSYIEDKMSENRFSSIEHVQHAISMPIRQGDGIIVNGQ